MERSLCLSHYNAWKTSVKQFKDLSHVEGKIKNKDQTRGSIYFWLNENMENILKYRRLSRLLPHAAALGVACNQASSTGLGCWCSGRDRFSPMDPATDWWPVKCEPAFAQQYNPAAPNGKQQAKKMDGSLRWGPLHWSSILYLYSTSWSSQ